MSYTDVYDEVRNTYYGIESAAGRRSFLARLADLERALSAEEDRAEFPGQVAMAL